MATVKYKYTHANSLQTTSCRGQQSHICVKSGKMIVACQSSRFFDFSCRKTAPCVFYDLFVGAKVHKTEFIHQADLIKARKLIQNNESDFAAHVTKSCSLFLFLRDRDPNQPTTEKVRTDSIKPENIFTKVWSTFKPNSSR